MLKISKNCEVCGFSRNVHHIFASNDYWAICGQCGHDVRTIDGELYCGDCFCDSCDPDGERMKEANKEIPEGCNDLFVCMR